MSTSLNENKKIYIQRFIGNNLNIKFFKNYKNRNFFHLAKMIAFAALCGVAGCGPSEQRLVEIAEERRKICLDRICPGDGSPLHAPNLVIFKLNGKWFTGPKEYGNPNVSFMGFHWPTKRPLASNASRYTQLTPPQPHACSASPPQTSLRPAAPTRSSWRQAHHRPCGLKNHPVVRSVAAPC